MFYPEKAVPRPKISKAVLVLFNAVILESTTIFATEQLSDYSVYAILTKVGSQVSREAYCYMFSVSGNAPPQLRTSEAQPDEVPHFRPPHYQKSKRTYTTTLEAT